MLCSINPTIKLAVAETIITTAISFNNFCIPFYSYPLIKNIMSDDKSDDIDAKMFAAYSCVDCGQEFQTREELEDHESTH